MKQLQYYLELGKPILIASPRRYGKTSLAINAIERCGLLHAHFDFLSAIDEQDIERIVLKGVGELIGKLEKGPKKALKAATDFFAGLNIKVVFNALGLAVEFNQHAEKTARTLLKLLERLEQMAQKYQQKLVLFFDEFQRLAEISQDQAIESILRQVAQQSKALVFIFSGSNRHLLEQMFNDRQRPFYKLCERINLQRIEADAYISYIQQAAHQQWSQELDEETLERIFYYTKRHPYYVNLLCSRLWQKEEINSQLVDRLWQQYQWEERSQVSAELDLLSKNQRKLLIVLARYGGTAEPRSLVFEQQARMSGATITQALHFLEKKDYVFRDEANFYQVLDPLIRAVLAEL